MTLALGAAYFGKGVHMEKELKKPSSFCGEVTHMGKGQGLEGI